MNNLLNKARYVVSGEDGASNVEIIVWISVVLIIASFLFAFRRQITDFIQSAINKVGKFSVEDGGEHGSPDFS